MAEHQERRIGRRKLYVVEPIGATQQRLDFAGLRVNADELQRPSFCQAVLHHLAFARIGVPARCRRWSRWSAFPNGCGQLVVNNSCEQRFVRIDCRDGRARRQFHNLVRGFGIEVRGIDGDGQGVVISHRLCVINLSGFSAHDDHADATVDDLFDRARLQVDRG